MKYTLNANMVKRHRPPKGGWRYVEPATGWKVPNPLQLDFRTTVSLIMSHRAANPAYNLPADQASVEEALMHATALRIMEECPEHTDSWVVPLDDEAKKSSRPAAPYSPPVRPGHVVRAAQERIESFLSKIRGIAKGAATLADWVGHGSSPVDPALAEHRASVCARCPKNRPDEGFEKLTGSVAEAIRRQITVKNALDLRTSHDDEIRTCDACGCHLRLKIWVPIVTIRGRMNDDDNYHLDPDCWILNEP